MSTFGASSETEFLNHYCNMLRNIPCGTKFLRFGDFLCLRELIFAIFRKYQGPSMIIFSFLLSRCNRNTYFQIINKYFVVFDKL